MAFKFKETRRKYDRERYRKFHPKVGRPPKAEAEKKLILHQRVRASILGRMQMIVTEGLRHGNFPWKTMAELHEDLLLRGLDSLKDDEFVAEMLPYLETQRHMQEVARLRREAQAAASTIKAETSELLAIGDDDGALNCFHTGKQDVLSWTKSPWREWLLRELDDAFPAFAHEKPKPVLLDFEPETDEELEAEERRQGSRRQSRHTGRKK